MGRLKELEDEKRRLKKMYAEELNDENALIANLLEDLTKSESDWGFGQCFQYLRNVKDKRWNHKRVVVL